MKKLLSLILVMVLCVCTACGQKEPAKDDSTKNSEVVTTTSGSEDTEAPETGEVEEPKELFVLTKETCYSSDGDIKYYYEYSRDDEGVMLKKTRYSAEGSIDSWYEYGYDSDGRRNIYTAYTADGTVDTLHEYEYDVQGNLTVEYTRTPSGKPRSQYDYEYDAVGNQIKETLRDADGNIHWWAGVPTTVLTVPPPCGRSMSMTPRATKSSTLSMKQTAVSPIGLSMDTMPGIIWYPVLSITQMAVRMPVMPMSTTLTEIR